LTKYEGYLVVVTVIVIASFTWFRKFRHNRGGAGSGEI
jgi:hypothetical protein